MAWFRSSSTQQPQAKSPTATLPAASAAATADEPAAGRSIVGAPAIDHPRTAQPGHSQSHVPHSMPVIGYPEQYYLKHVQDADKSNDILGRDAYKVGQYVTLGVDHKEPPDRKAKYFNHALRRHATAPAGSTVPVADFYQRLADVVRKHAGQEVLRLAKRESEMLQKRLSGGTNRETLKQEFHDFFRKLTGESHHHCPEWLSHECWDQLRAIRSHWS
jgi:hypothetical protein